MCHCIPQGTIFELGLGVLISYQYSSVAKILPSPNEYLSSSCGDGENLFHFFVFFFFSFHNFIKGKT